MNTEPNAMNESAIQPQATAPSVSVWRVMYWSIRRELWENRSIYIAPLTAAAVFLIGFAIHLIMVRTRAAASHIDLHLNTSHFDPSHMDPSQPQGLLSHYELSASLIMGTAFIVGIFYSLEALYGERRDRSILFWKSLPVSDLTTVLAKASVPLVILPLLAFAITAVTDFVMILLSSLVLLGSGANIAALWTEVPFFHVSLVLFYHLLTVHGLYYAPIYGWLLLVSVWAPRAPFISALLPPVEKTAFNSTYFLTLLEERLMGPGGSMSQHDQAQDFAAALIPHHFFSNPGLWIGLVVAAAFLAIAVRLRRDRGPI